MSAKSAKYVGPSGTGVDVAVPFDDGAVEFVHVPQGEQLPATTPSGRKIPGALVDSLLEQDCWDAKGSSSTAKKEQS